MERAQAKLLTSLSFVTGAWLPIALWVRRAGSRGIIQGGAARAPVGLVLGAVVKAGRPQPMLEDRLLTAIELLRAKRVDRLLLSGDGQIGETEAMWRFATEAGVPAGSLIDDPHARHTYESLRNARMAGHRDLLVITQRFHLPRALFLAQAFELMAQGVPADRRGYVQQAEYRAREVFSSVLAFWMTRGEVRLSPPAR